MARTVYNIACRDGIKQISGYTFGIGELKFGVSNQSPATGNNIIGWWVVTELSTGYSCASAGTKKEAINYVLKKEVLDTIKKGIEAAAVEDINKDITIGTIYYAPV